MYGAAGVLVDGGRKSSRPAREHFREFQTRGKELKRDSGRSVNTVRHKIPPSPIKSTSSNGCVCRSSQQIPATWGATPQIQETITLWKVRCVSTDHTIDESGSIPYLRRWSYVPSSTTPAIPHSRSGHPTLLRRLYGSTPSLSTRWAESGTYMRLCWNLTILHVGLSVRG